MQRGGYHEPSLRGGALLDDGSTRRGADFFRLPDVARRRVAVATPEKVEARRKRGRVIFPRDARVVRHPER